MTRSRRKKEPKPAAMTPGEFRAILERSGLTQGQFAERIGYTREMVNRWATGTALVSVVVKNHIQVVMGRQAG